MKNRDLKKNVTKSVTPVEKDSKKEIEENSSDDGSLMNGKEKHKRGNSDLADKRRQEYATI